MGQFTWRHARFKLPSAGSGKMPFCYPSFPSWCRRAVRQSVESRSEHGVGAHREDQVDALPVVEVFAEAAHVVGDPDRRRVRRPRAADNAVEDPPHYRPRRPRCRHRSTPPAGPCRHDGPTREFAVAAVRDPQYRGFRSRGDRVQEYSRMDVERQERLRERGVVHQRGQPLPAFTGLRRQRGTSHESPIDRVVPALGRQGCQPHGRRGRPCGFKGRHVCSSRS